MPRYVRVRDVDKQGEVDSYWLPEAEVVASGGSGDVSGPASATDDHLAVFDGITGKLIKDGGAVSIVPVKASGAELDTGTDDAKFATAKALVDSAYAKTTDITATAVGLANADNTSDANKPVSSATQTALNLKANDTAVVHDTGDETVAGVKTFSSDPIIPDEIYGVGWDGSLEPPTKNAVYDKIETLGAAGIGGSTGATDNAILRADGAGGATAQPSTAKIDDNGAINLGGAGSTAAPMISLSTDTNTGFYSRALGFGLLDFTSGGIGRMEFGGTGISFPDSSRIGWESGAGLGLPSVGISFISAGVIGVGTGAVGSIAGSLSLTNLKVAGVPFGSLPGSPVTGDRATVTDSTTATYRATIAGGGANIVPAFFDGTNWIVS